MNKHFRERFTDWLKGGITAPPVITENSSLKEIVVPYPSAFDFIERKYGIKIEAGDKALSLRDFTDKYDLPPSQIVFMEVQLDFRTRGVREVPAREVAKLLKSSLPPRLLDVREAWELKLASIREARPLTPQLLDEILNEWPKDTAIVVFCHFGIRSMDAATFLVDRGFSQVSILKGGIDAWSIDVDPKIVRYQNAWC